MIHNVDDFIASFVNSAMQIGLEISENDFEQDAQTAPHTPPSLPEGKCAIYIFSLSEHYGVNCPAGPNRVLKIGKVGPHSNNRFQYQHYNPNAARSTLAGSLYSSQIIWPYLGINGLSIDEVANWIKQHTDRNHLYLDAHWNDHLYEIECYLRALLSPIFEG